MARHRSAPAPPAGRSPGRVWAAPADAALPVQQADFIVAGDQGQPASGRGGVPSAIRRANGPLAGHRQVRVQREQGISGTNGERGPGAVIGHHLADLAYLDLGQDLHRYDHRTIVALVLVAVAQGELFAVLP
jgi:hypothetical protein